MATLDQIQTSNHNHPPKKTAKNRQTPNTTATFMETAGGSSSHVVARDKSLLLDRHLVELDVEPFLNEL